MFGFLTQRFHDMKRLTKVFTEAERLANAEGQAEPGAEHMVMAALTLPEDGSARAVLAEFDRSPEDFRTAVAGQFDDALGAIGIKASPLPAPELVAAEPNNKKDFYRATRSMHDLLDAVTTNKQFTHKNPFTTAEIILGATCAQFGVVARAFERMGLDRGALAEAARREIDKHKCR